MGSYACCNAPTRSWIWTGVATALFDLAKSLIGFITPPYGFNLFVVSSV